MGSGPGCARALAALALGLLAGAAAAGPADLRVCLLADNPPYGLRTEARGFDLEVGAAVARASGRALVPIWVDNDRRIQELEESDLPSRRLARGECDAIFSVPGPASDSLRGVDGLALGQPYYGAAFELIACAPDVRAELGALSGRKLAIQSQTIAHFAAIKVGALPVTYFTPEEAFEALLTLDAEAALLWGPAVGWHLEQGHVAHRDLHESAFDECGIVKGYVPPVALRWNLHVATRAADGALRAAIDAALADMRADGRFAALARRYGVPLHEPFDTTYTPAALRDLGGGD